MPQKEPLKIVELISPTVCTLQEWDICQKKVSYVVVYFWARQFKLCAVCKPKSDKL